MPLRFKNKMQIIKNIRNELLKRNEITAVVNSEKNPSIEEVRKKISEETGKPEENIEVYNIKGSFGSRNFKVSSKIYDNKENLKKSKIKEKKIEKSEEKTEEIK